MPRDPRSEEKRRQMRAPKCWHARRHCGPRHRINAAGLLDLALAKWLNLFLQHFAERGRSPTDGTLF